MEVLVYFCKNWRQESGFRESHRCIPDGSVVKNLPSKQEMWVQSLVWKDPLEEEMATHSSIHAWKIPRTEEPGRLQSTGLQSQTWLSAHARACTHARTHTLSLSLSEFEKCRHLRPQPRLLHVCMYVQLLQWCLTLSNTMDCSPPGTFVHGILQASILEWVAIPSPGDLWDPGIEPASPGFQDLLHKNLPFIKMPRDL